jgi:hypothetical protein
MPPQPSGPTRPGDPRAPGEAVDHSAIQQVAPIPSQPTLFPPGTEYYLVPITFELILREPQRQVQPGR